ncbi:hypothetical protein JCM8202_000966 [Rhodotorula sphaerocarpa]
MLVVRVLPTSGNPNNLFGYHGIWGLEPVYVCGKIGCTYDERASGKPPKVKSVQVCLVRLEMVRNTTAREKMAAATIWTPPDGQESAEVGQVDIPFELALPEDVKGMSSMTMFPTARVLYLVEASATLASGRNITAENKTMHVVRFARSPMDPSSTSPISWSSSTVFDQPIPFEYSVRIPNVLLTPEEYLPVYITVKAPEDAPGPVHLKGYELSTKRQIHLASTGAPSGPIETTTFAYESEILAARTERPSTRANGPKKRPIIPDSEGMEIETDPPGLPIFEKDTFPMVLQPGESRTGMARLRMRERGFHAWSYGETGTNDAFRIQFYLAFKFFLKKGRSSESIKLKWRPVHLCSAEDFPAQPRPLLVQSPSRESIGSYDEYEHIWPPFEPPRSTKGARVAFPRMTGPHASPYGRDPRISKGKMPMYSQQRERRTADPIDPIGAPARTRARRNPPGMGQRRYRVGDSATADSLVDPDRPPSPGSSVAGSSVYPQSLASARYSSRWPRGRHKTRSVVSGNSSAFTSSGTSVSNISMASYGTASSSSGQSTYDSRKPRRRAGSAAALAGMSKSTIFSSSSSAFSSLEGMPGLHISDEAHLDAPREEAEWEREQETLASAGPSGQGGYVPNAPLGSSAAPPSPPGGSSSRDPFADILTPHGTLIKSSLPELLPITANTTPLSKKELKEMREAERIRAELLAAAPPAPPIISRQIVSKSSTWPSAKLPPEVEQEVASTSSAAAGETAATDGAAAALADSEVKMSTASPAPSPPASRAVDLPSPGPLPETEAKPSATSPAPPSPKAAAAPKARAPTAPPAGSSTSAPSVAQPAPTPSAATAPAKKTTSVEPSAPAPAVSPAPSPAASSVTRMSSTPPIAENGAASSASFPPPASSRRASTQMSIRMPSMERRASASPSASVASNRKSGVGNLFTSLFTRRASKVST